MRRDLFAWSDWEVIMESEAERRVEAVVTAVVDQAADNLPETRIYT